ncbi:hypothetical protein RDI58_018049 [Solanum bulbocastanum]|uniref:Uncharacterized protein n=1 Tax=Solanum bulbocastanum TaxID=147425 RepID=A0AAN8TDG5_SOLBU
MGRFLLHFAQSNIVCSSSQRKMNIQTSSNKKSKKSSNTTPSTRRIWIPEEEQTLLDGLKELCANGWRGDNGTFRPGHLMELEVVWVQYSDGTIIVDDPKHWIDFIKIDPQAKKMNTKKWPLFADWEEIFGKDRAT